ncbi:MAG: tandem-95 repeat protein, partial [Candidatus Cryosericum sp.]
MAKKRCVFTDHCSVNACSRSCKWGLAAVLLLLVLNLPVGAVRADTPALALSRTSGTYVESDTNFYVDPGIQITYSGAINGAKVSIGSGFSAVQDQLLYSTTGGIVGSYNTAAGVLTLSGAGTGSSYQAALRAVRFYNSSDNPSTLSRSITISLSDGSLYNEDNGHYYEFVPAANITWTDACTGAANRLLFGLQGYLATITSAQENNFLTAKVSGTAWIGANDVANEGTWQWVTGPEAGKTLALYGYSNWAFAEPNNSGGTEDYCHMMTWTTPPGQWNDLADAGGSGQYASTGYVVEYGGMLDDPVLQLSVSVSIAIQSVNDPPVAATDSYMTAEDIRLAIPAPGVLANDSDVDGQTLTAAIDFNNYPKHGTAVLGSDGSLTYTPDRDYCGSDSFKYRASDGILQTSLTTVNLQISAVNDAPDGITLSNASIVENSPPGTEVGFFLTHDVDTTVGFTYYLIGPDATAFLLSDGNHLVLARVLDYEVQHSCMLRVRTTDAGGLLYERDFFITVTDANDAPSAVLIANSTVAENQPPGTLVGVLDTADQDTNDTHSYALAPGSGASDNACFAISGASLSTATSFNYEVRRSYSIRIRTTDSGGLSFERPLSITVTNVNEQPTATPCSLVTIEDTSCPIILSGSDPDGDPLTYAVVGAPSHGTLSGSPPVLVYTPSVDYPSGHFHAADSFTFTVTDGSGLSSAPGTVSVDIVSVNDAPTFVVPAIVMLSEDSLAGTLPLVASDADGDPVTFGVLGGDADTVAASISGNTLYLTTASDYNTLGLPLTVTANDGQGATTTVLVTVVVDPVNDVPSFTKGDDQTVPEDCGAQTVNSWATAIIPGPANEAPQVLTLIATNNNNALFSVQPAVSVMGILTYTPAADANGSATVSLTLTDDATAGGPALTTAPHCFTITVAEVNDAPVAMPDTFVVPEEGILTLTPSQLLSNDLKGPPNESGQVLTLLGVGATPVNCSVSLDADTITVHPSTDFNGTITFDYTIQDNGTTARSPDFRTASDLVTVTVTAVNDAPSFAKGADQAVSEDCGIQTVAGWATGMSAGPADEAIQSLAFIVSNDNNALFSTQPAIAADGTLTYCPAASMNGSATVTVRIHDNGGTANGGGDTSAAQTFTITVAAVNDAPSFTNGAAQTVLEDCGAQTVPGWATAIQAGPADESQQSLTFRVTGNTDPSLFSVAPSISPDGTLAYTPDLDANGTAMITVTLQDDGGTTNGGLDTSAPQTFTITVAPVNDAPSFTKGADQMVIEDCGPQAVSGWATAISAGPPDEAAQAIDFLVSNDKNALFGTQPAVSPAGTLTYTLAANMNGSATVTVRIHDNGGMADGGVAVSALQAITITVTAANDAPVNTTLPAISGTPHIGRTLSTTDGLWNDAVDLAPGVLSYSYQWQRSTNGGATYTDIPGATNSTCTLTIADNLQLVRSSVTCTDDGEGVPAYQSVSAVSAPATILNAPPVIAEGPAIAASCDEDESPAPFVLALHATDPDGTDALEWQIVSPPAHGVVTLAAGPAGLTAVPAYHPVSGWNGIDSFVLHVQDSLTGFDEIAVTVIVNPRNDAPVNTLLPNIVGDVFVNHEVHAMIGDWNDNVDCAPGTLTYAYQWLRARDATGTGLTLIPGATASSYVVSPFDEGMYLAVRVTCSDDGEGLPEVVSTNVDSGFVVARYLDVTPPTIEVPELSSWPCVTDYSGSATSSFTVTDAAFLLPVTVDDDRMGGVQVSISVGGRTVVTSGSGSSSSYALQLAEGPN